MLLLGIAWLSLSPFAALAQNWGTGSDGLATVPPLTARITDLSNTLTGAERQALEAKLAGWEQKTGNQLVVLMVPSTQPEPVEAYSLRVAEAWKIGRKGRDNGIVFLIAKNDRKMRLEVGYGLEGVVPDAVAKRIIAETVTPFFRQGQFAAGIDAGVDRIIDVVDKGEPSVAPAGSSPTPIAKTPGFGLETLLILLFVVVPIVGSILRRMFGKLLGSTLGAGIVGYGAWIVAGSLLIALAAAAIAWFVMLAFSSGVTMSSMPRGRGGWGGGFGGGGGGFGGGGGGFGGGGGSFGGGGASGGW